MTRGCAAEVGVVFRVACGVAFVCCFCVDAGLVVVCGDGEGFLELQGRFDDGGDQARRDVPFDVAVEEPDTGVVGAESDHKVAARSHHEGIPAHRDLRQVCVCGDVAGGEVVSGVFVGTHDDLEAVAVEVKGVLARVCIVEDDFDDFVLLENEGVGVDAIDCGVGGVGAGGEDGVEGGDLGADVGHVVDECTVRSMC